MARLPLWLDTRTGSVIGSNNRPNGYVKVLQYPLNGGTAYIKTTIDDVFRLLTTPIQGFPPPIARNDLDKGDLYINSYAEEGVNRAWVDFLNSQRLMPVGTLPYISYSISGVEGFMVFAYQDTVTDGPDEFKQAYTGQAEENTDDELRRRGGGGGGGGGGPPVAPSSKGEPAGPAQEPAEPSGEPVEPAEEPGEKGNPYEVGKAEADKLDEDRKEKMKEILKKIKGGDKPGSGDNGDIPGGAAPGEAEKGESGQGEPAEQGDAGEVGEQGEGAGGEEGDALDDAVQAAKEGMEEAQEAADKADAENAQDAADAAQEAANNAAQEAAEQEGTESEEKAQQAQDYADEAQDAADAAQELEDMIREMFDEQSEFGEEDFEEFKEGVLDELHEEIDEEMDDDGEGSEPESGDKSQENPDTPEKSSRFRSKFDTAPRLGRRYVNYETGEVRVFGPDEAIGDDWLEVTPFFSGIFVDGRELVVDRTLDGAKELVRKLGGSVSNQTPTSFTFQGDDANLTSLLKKMRMFIVSDDKVSY